MKLWSLPFWRLASGQKCPSARLAALFMSVLCSLPLVPVGAQQATYFYAGKQKVSLTPATNWSGVQVASGKSASSVAAIGSRALGAQAQVYARQNVVLFSKANAGAAALKDVKRKVRVFNNGSLAPIVETDEILVRFKSGVSAERAKQLALSVGASLGALFGPTSPNAYRAYVNTNTTAIDASNALSLKSEVLWANPNFIWQRQVRFTPADPRFAQQWHLDNTGQNGGTAGADIKAVAAWDITQGSSGITIAVVDTGIDIDHEDLKNKIVSPRDVVDDDNDPRPTGADEEHGTAVAGLAAATGNNTLGVTGVAINCKIMPIRLVVAGSQNDDEAEAFQWATDHGADVICNSWGPTDGVGVAQPIWPATKDAIDYATTVGRGGKGCVVLFASGNGNESVDLDGYASYSRVIAVGSSTNRDLKSSFSDFGRALDIVAPGGELGGTNGLVTTDASGAKGYTGGDYLTNADQFVGTSAACPVAAGAAALVLSRDPSLTYVQLLQRLQQTADKIDPATGNYDGTGHSDRYGSGRINLLRALQAAPAGAFSISGIVRKRDLTPVPNVLITADAFGLSTFTGADGRYSLTGLGAGSTNVTASDPNFVFVPASRAVVLGPNARFINFTAEDLPNVTLATPPSNIEVNTVTYPLSATTANDNIVTRLNFERSGAPVRFNRAPNRPLPDAIDNFFSVTPSITTDSLTLSQAGDAATIGVRVNIAHPSVQDLIITLISPDKRRFPVYSQALTGGSLVTTFENVPVGSSKIAGTWQLEVADTTPGFFGPDADGTLISWGLIIEPWVAIGSDTLPNALGEWTATWDVTKTPPGTYLVRAVTTVAGVVYEDIHTDIVVPEPSILLQTPLANSTISGFYTLRAKGTNVTSIKNVGFWQRTSAATFSRGSSTSPLNLAIPDRTVVTDQLTVPGGGIAEGATLNIDIAHQFIGDIKVSLITPDGQTLPIFSDPTNGGVRLRKGFNLPTLVGKAFSGKYTLQIEDINVPDTGRLLTWSLSFRQPWTLIGTDSTPSTSGIYTKGLDTQTLPGGLYDFRAVATSAGSTVEDVHLNVTVDSTKLPTYPISGVVKKGTANLAGVTITRSGGGLANATVVTNTSGAYTLPAAPNGDYVVTPSFPGHSFIPFSRNVHIENGQIIDANFAAVVGATISGKILDASGAPLAGIPVQRSGSTVTQVTDAGGAYHFVGLSAGVYTISPTKDGYGFAPLSRSVRVDTTDVSGVDFVGVVGFFIKGRITTSAGTPLPNVRVARTSSASATTNANGEYLLSGVPNGSFYLTPTRDGFSFQPQTRLITVNGAGVSDVDFIGVQGVTVSGRVTNSTGTGISGVRIQRAGIPGTLTATTNAAGTYSFDSVQPGTYILQPSGAGYAFTPASRSVTVGTSSLANLNFQGTLDSVGPVVTTTQPTARLYRELPVAAGTVSDDASGVGKVTGRVYRFANGATPSGYWAGGENWTTSYTAANEILATGTSNWVLNLPTLPTGEYTFRPTAWDNAGNRTFGSVVRFTMDTTLPQVQVQSPVSTNYNTVPPRSAEGTAQDGESGVARVTIRLRRNATSTTAAGYWAGGTTWTTGYSAVNEIAATGTTDWSVSLPNLPTNSYTLRATAKDKAGNAASSADIAFTTGAARLNSVQTPGSEPDSSSEETVSIIAATASNDSVTLAFGTALSPAAASPLRFTVIVNGHVVAVPGVNLTGGQVTLLLPQGSLKQGATVQVAWSKLPTAQGGTIAAGNASTTAK